ncbi:unnamed protein product [Clavelina lepadiformis]|uniref:Thyroglobulin type-1 domain-containing protein n=1 Tax=Clavelina lepadiformis TaxID=159417 RepID=A0ABP0F576_CLALP
MRTFLILSLLCFATMLVCTSAGIFGSENCIEALHLAEEKEKRGLLGVPVPKCAIDGRWKPVQCVAAYCWCVDGEGNEKPGTLKFLSQPNCH